MLQNPINTGSDYFKYKGFISVKLLRITALCTFLLDVKDGYPTEECLTTPGRNSPVLYILLADDAFLVRPSIMKQFPGAHDKGNNKRVYNYSHCRARRMVERYCLGLLRKHLLLEPENTERVVMICFYLHNFLRRSQSSSASYAPLATFDFEDTATRTLVPEQWRVDGMPTGTMLRLKRVPKKPSVLANEIREEFSGYFTNTE
ncbi:hypothetical protein PR048_009912, partial [Dryococelus australis]